MSKKEEIPALSFILEPALVASLLTAGCLVNRRRPADIVMANNLADSTPERATSDSWVWKEMQFFVWTVKVPDNARFRTNLSSRFLATFPFLMEVWYWLLTYWVYQIARACQALTMGSTTRAVSERHARHILALEAWLHIDLELGLQHAVMKSEWLLWFFNKTYAMVHIPATIAFFAYSYRYFNPQIFQATRRTLVVCNCLAFIIFSSWPCMPPRLLPKKEFGYVDTLHTGKAASIWTTNKFQNQLAAFPSLHFGYSFVIGVSLFVYSPHRLVRALSLFYPLLILLVIMATANHYVIDAIGGFIVTVVAHKMNRMMLNLRAPEEWFFWAVRTEKPMDKAQFEQAILKEGDCASRPLMD